MNSPDGSAELFQNQSPQRPKPLNALSEVSPLEHENSWRSEEQQEWFAPGSAFDSGEDLAAALLSMAHEPSQPGSHRFEFDNENEEVIERSTGSFEYVSSTAFGDSSSSSAPALTGDNPAPFPWPEQQKSEQFQASSVPTPISKDGIEPNVQSKEAVHPMRWRIRNSTESIKRTEKIVEQLRRDAINVTWGASAIVLSRKKRKSG